MMSLRKGIEVGFIHRGLRQGKKLKFLPPNVSMGVNLIYEASVGVDGRKMIFSTY